MWKLLQEPSVRSVMTHTITIRPLTMIGAPTSAGAYGPGQERAPEVFRRYGLVDAMAAKSIVAHDVGDVPGAEWRPDPSKPNAQNVEEVAKVASALGEQSRAPWPRDTTCSFSVGIARSNLARSSEPQPTGPTLRWRTSISTPTSIPR